MLQHRHAERCQFRPNAGRCPRPEGSDALKGREPGVIASSQAAISSASALAAGAPVRTGVVKPTTIAVAVKPSADRRVGVVLG
jgi:hypothetical protein